MKTTGMIVVQVLSGPTRQILRRSFDERISDKSQDLSGILSKALTSYQSPVGRSAVAANPPLQ